jgi:anti-sigma B factor antagonist
MDQLNIETIPGTQPGVRILKLTGPFTLATVFDFQTVVREESSPVTIIDLSGVPYMDSAALGSILGFHVSCQREGTKYGLVGVSDRLKTLFRVAGVDGMLSSYGTAEEATAATA